MNISLTFKKLIIVILLSGTGSFTIVSAEESKGLAPKATAAEVELDYRDIPLLENAFIDTTPADQEDGIAVGELGIDGGNKDMIVKLAQEIAENNPDNYDSLLIAHKGKLIFESYYQRGRVNLPHYQASATKTYTSLALGRAIQLGYLTMDDLDKPILSFLRGLDAKKFADGAELITLHQALTMTTGIRIAREKWAEFERSTGELKGQKQVQAIFEHTAPITAESQVFLYGTGPDLIMQVIDAVVPGSAEAFIKNELLDKLGITQYRWRTRYSGLPESGWRTTMTSRAMTKWGMLAANKGKWKGEQLISSAFIEKATSRILYTGDEDIYGGGKDVSGQGYGYFWWNADLKHGDKSYFAVNAQGGNGQFIILVEELDLMVIITAHKNDHITLQRVAERILPAFIQ
jgi:CubicO group peptidase (beta-lactamase class C family)